MEFQNIDEIKKYISENRASFEDLLNAEQEKGKEDASNANNAALLDEIKGLREQVKAMQEYNIKHDEQNDPKPEEVTYLDALASIKF